MATSLPGARPHRDTRPTAKLGADNTAPLQLTTHRVAVAEACKKALKTAIVPSPAHPEHSTSTNASTSGSSAPHDSESVGIQSIEDGDDDAEMPETFNRTADLEHFFKPVPHVKGNLKGRAVCQCCSANLAYQHTTLRRHMGARHQAAYYKWANENNFESMLPEDTKQRRQDLAENLLRQTSTEDHFKLAAVEKSTLYSHEAFKHAAIEWLVETDQPIQTFEHPKFKRMIDIASHATHGVKLPSRKQTRQEIICQFKEQMKALKERMNSHMVSGEISLTCDAWQASNGDSYFAVTGHWIEEPTAGNWIERDALLGFTPMNTAHNGVQLGQSLYQICNRLAIVHKIGHITCDNASNNSTMLDEFAKCYHIKTCTTFEIAKRHIRCLAHIINLGTQAMISARSKAKYYSPDLEESHITDLTNEERDEVGLVRMISVKARSSAPRKELFKSIQIQNQVKPLQLLIDMKVRWSSTHAMLLRAESRKVEVDLFVYQLSMKETNAEKRRKIGELTLSKEEWTCVKLFNNLLAYADNAQHAFSAEARPTLHTALPAIERLFGKWKSASTKEQYKPFRGALNAGMKKLDEYYERTAASDAHIIAMVLDPKRKFEHFRKNWGLALLEEVKEAVQSKFIERYNKLQSSTNTAALSMAKKRVVKATCRDLDDTDSDDDNDGLDPATAWMLEWNVYLQTHETIPDGMGIVCWWGLNSHRYPTWASLARDYLAIMASSVSSERAFSSAGITISKRRNRLKGDIVEALQCLKCLCRRDLLFREVSRTQDVEVELETIDDCVKEHVDYVQTVLEADKFSWDQLLEDNNGDTGEDII